MKNDTFYMFKKGVKCWHDSKKDTFSWNCLHFVSIRLLHDYKRPVRIRGWRFYCSDI